MKRLLSIIMLIVCVLAKADAQYYSVNYDKQTVAAMAAAYGTEAVAEAYYNEQVQNILKHYNAAEVASAGIFASKFLERKAMTDLGIWNSSTENYYYRRIYNMVSGKIMPKIWTVAGMMLKSPQTALYWGTYLMKICDDTKNLCMQFESVVTNSTLTFSDIAFLQINQEIAAILKLSEIGNVDWKKMLDDLSKVPGNFTVDNLKSDIDNLYKAGANLAGAGMNNIGNALLQSSQFNDLFQGKLSAAIDIVDNYSSLFKSLDKSVGNTLLGMIGGKDNVAGLFTLANYNLTSWMTDYLDETAGNYYTQRWYIARRDQGREKLCDYVPPTDDNSILKGDHWYRINTKDANFHPNNSQKEAILQNSENHAGWSRTRVQQLNNQNDGFTYSISYWLNSYIISSKKKGQKQKAYAYEIQVYKSWNRTEEVYEAVFDSYSMDLNTFKAQLQARLSEWNDNEEGYTYYIGSDARNYYQATDAAKLKGCESVTISVTCSDGVQLGQGTTQYKCKSCGGSLNDHSKKCAMTTSVTENTLDLSDLYKQEQEANAKIASLQSQISQLEAENKSLVKQIANASVEDAAKYREQYNKNKASIEQLNKELATWQQKQRKIEEAKAEAGKDNDVATDDYYRIPAIMNDCKSAYNLTWQGEGTWSGYTYIRKATMPNINGIITRTTGEHLHFGVKNISADGKTRDVDPASYLAEIAQKGNLKQQALYNGNDLLAKYKGNSSAVDTSLSPDDWMKKLLSSEDASTGLSSVDPIMGLVTTMYSSLLALAVQIDSKSEEEQRTQISEAVSKRQVDLKPLMPTMKECVLSVGDNGKAVLQADNGTTKVTRELTNAEFCRLSQVLGDTNLSNDAKKMRIAGMVNTIVLTQQASQNYEQVLEQQEGQSQTMQRK